MASGRLGRFLLARCVGLWRQGQHTSAAAKARHRATADVSPSEASRYSGHTASPMLSLLFAPMQEGVLDCPGHPQFLVRHGTPQLRRSVETMTLAEISNPR